MKKHRKNKNAPPPGLPPESEQPVEEQPKKQPFLKRLLFGEETPDLSELEVLEPRYTDDFVLKLLYELINKGTSLRVKLPEGVFDMTTEVHGVYGE